MYTFPLSKKRSRVKEENVNGQNVQLSPWVACSYKAIGMLFLEAWDDRFLWKTRRGTEHDCSYSSCALPDLFCSKMLVRDSSMNNVLYGFLHVLNHHLPQGQKVVYKRLENTQCLKMDR